MKLKVSLFSYLRDGRGKEVVLDITEETTVTDVMKMLKIKDDELSNILINDVDADFSSRFKEGDRVALFPPLAGG
jgi:molybdopterin converting factor small subunit